MLLLAIDEQGTENIKCFAVDKDGRQTEIEPEEVIELQDNNYLIVSNGDDGPEYRNNFDYLKFEESSVLKQYYQGIAQKIVAKYSKELYKVNPSEIVFEVDTAWELSDKTSANSRWKIGISRAPKMFKHATGFEYIVRMRQHWIDKWTPAQVNAAIMSQLLRINPADGAILKYSEDIHSRMIATFGKDYLEPQTVIPDILKDDVKIADFRKASGQVHMDEIQDAPNEAEEAEGDNEDPVGLDCDGTEGEEDSGEEQA